MALEWMALPPKALLFGATSAALRYNCFSRLIAVLFNMTFGISLVAYFDDFGPLVPKSLCRRAIRTFEQFRDTLGIKLKSNKAAYGRIVTSLGLEGDSPHPVNDMCLRISLSPDNARNWGEMISRILQCGVITHGELESTIGRLSFAQTSIFVRFGRAMISPVYAKLHSKNYRLLLEDRERTALGWWAVALSQLHPLMDLPKPSVTQKMV